ncbi:MULTISPECIES: hypothetical protein [Amycolatopsis]|uniref:PH domain-containing protein n=1 Tax=Amycolatopsis bullii TaxID=941987 RepID=A0ABQ3K2K6_9PSEU|nr:hypothetical protein [Amycolatopsis bullii]GHG00519.1 hypothetical protein GCM10017567_14230 [Amycolatopsis bullii]
MNDRPEVELANRNGRLHPAQRGALLDLTFWLTAAVVIAGLVVTVSLALVATTAGEVLGTVVPLLAITGWFAFVCWRRLADAFGGRLAVVTGWTHDFGTARLTDEYPIGLHRSPEGFKSLESFSLRAGGRTYPLERKLRERIRPDRVNTVLIAPRSKVLINVLPA